MELTKEQINHLLKDQAKLKIAGQWHWLVIHSGGEQEWLYSDTVEVTDNGDLIFSNYYRRNFGDDSDYFQLLPTSSFSKGTWERFYAASVLSGDPVKTS
jgi:hypothetical protein